MSDTEEVSIEHQASTDTLPPLTSDAKKNPNYHRLHTGKWIPKEYEVGRLVELTGVWTCCGNPEHYSMYCESIEVRNAYQKMLSERAAQKQLDEEYAQFVKENRLGPWLRNEVGEAYLGPEDFEAMTLRNTNTSDSSSNVLMLISWIKKHIHDATTVHKGLQFIHRHTLTGEGCIQVLRHNGLPLMQQLTNIHKSEDILLIIVSIFRQVLECNLTRDDIIEDVEYLSLIANIGYTLIHSPMHVEHTVNCILQYSRSQTGRDYIINAKYIGVCLLYCRRYLSHIDIVIPIIKLFNWVTCSDERLIYVYKIGGGKATLKCMQKHVYNANLLAPAILFFTRVSAIHAPAMEYLVEKRAVPIVISALRSLYNQDLLQLEGLKMLREMAKSQDGWDQISNTKGGWHGICQGTIVGNALIHDLKGSFHNPGWCIGETPYLPALERQKLAAAKAAASKSAIVPKAAWTAHSLRQFMGLNMKQQRLAINLEEHEVYFEIIHSLDLLPLSGEEKEYWFVRVKEYETDNDISIEEMVKTVIDMRRKERKDAREARKLEENAEYIKPVYVMGKLISTKALEEADINITSQLEGVV